jgi:hypothetical protein
MPAIHPARVIRRSALAKPSHAALAALLSLVAGNAGTAAEPAGAGLLTARQTAVGATPRGAATASAAPSPASRPNAERVGVLITDWAEPEGLDPQYRRDVVKRSFGPPLRGPEDPCAKYYIGPPGFKQFLGLTPYALGVKTPGLESAYDSMGLYRLSKDGTAYEALYDPSVKIAVKDVPNVPGTIVAAKDITRPLARSYWAIDPRDGTNYLDGVVMIGAGPMAPGSRPSGAAPGPGAGPAGPPAMPNGIRDADEISLAGAITDMSILYEDLTPRLSPATQHIEGATARMVRELFGDQVDVRFGAYAATEFQTRTEDDVALDFAREGFRRIVLTRETTDNNNYANNFMTRGYVDLALCRAGMDGVFQYQQSRQVGRTPEYNLALLHVARTNFDQIAPGSEVTVLYTTYGLPFPERALPGPFSAPHPWSSEVYHENAYNNYISFKRYLEAYYGDRYRLVFNPRGRSGDARLDNWYSYGLATAADFTAPEPENRFRTLRENIDAAKKEGRREILAVLSHWYYNGRDPLLAVRAMQGIPLNGRSAVRDGKLWISWCERVDSARSVPCDSNDPSLVRLQYSDTFDRYAHEFAVGYAQNIRGAVERFGVFPVATGLRIAARGAVDREGGGAAEVKSGELRGARVQVARDAHPNVPESFDAKTYRAFTDPADNFVSAWDSFEAYIGTQNVPLDRLAKHSRVVGPAVLFGPYRTIVNRPATFTLPLAAGTRLSPDEAARLRAFVYNEASEDWDPVFLPAGSAPLRYDARTRRATFDTQVFGVFALAVTPEGWTPMKAVTHRYHQSINPRPLGPWNPAGAH